jgi:hypothetical protein
MIDKIDTQETPNGEEKYPRAGDDPDDRLDDLCSH